MALPRPFDVKGVRRLLGMFGYYRKFIPNFSSIAEPISRLTRQSIKFDWNIEQERALAKLKDALKEDVLLYHYNHNDPLMLKTDASKSGVAGMLYQSQGGEWRLIACCSRRVSKAEENYGISDLEGLAIVYSLNKLRPYVLGKKVKLLTDHCALCILKRGKPNSARLNRWAILLSEYDLEIVYTSGALHQDVDCLSRAPVDDADEYFNTRVFLCKPKNVSEWIKKYNDEESKEIIDQANTSNEYEIRDEVIYRNGKLYVPNSERKSLIEFSHKSHSGILVSQQSISEYWWPSLQKDVANFVKSCVQCQVRKTEKAKPAGYVRHFHFVQPLECLATDLFGPLTLTVNGNKYVMIVIDAFTRFIEAKAMPDLKGTTTVRKIH